MYGLKKGIRGYGVKQMIRRSIGKNAVIMLFCINIFYILTGLFRTEFCYFFRNTKDPDHVQADPAAVKKQNQDFFQLNENMSSLEFRKSERFPDCNLEDSFFWSETSIAAKFLRILWLIVSVLAWTITLRKCMQVNYMQKSDGKKRLIQICGN